MRMVEKMALAIHDVIWPAQEWDGDETACRAIAEVAARCALKAMREPDDAMREVFAKADSDGWYADDTWSSAIDKALESGE